MGMGTLSMFIPFVMALGLAGLPLGMPPLPEDPLLSRVAPEECLWYVSSAGIAVPQAESQNATERLLAEPELQTLYTKIETQILENIRRESRGDEAEMEALVKGSQLIRMIATRPFALYVSKVVVNGEGPPTGEAGLLVNLGEDGAKIEAALEHLEQMLARGEAIKKSEEAGVTWHHLPQQGPTPPVAWGIRGRYLIVGVGEKAGPNLIARAASNPPAWLSAAKSRLPVERVSVVSYLNLAKIREMAGPFMLAPEVSSIVQAFDADRMDALVSVSGLDEKGCVSKTLLQLSDEGPRSGGLLELVGSGPLTEADLQHIPADATIAAAKRVDSSKVLDWMLNLVALVEPRAKEDFASVEGPISQITQADLRTEILPALGDVWSLYSSPADGGFPFTGAVLSVSVKDYDTLNKVQNNLVDFLRTQLPDPPEEPRRSHANLRKIQVGGETVYYLNVVERDFPFAPAWCLTKDRLTVAFYPQSIKGMLSVDSQDKRLADTPEVAAELSAATPPWGMVYVDTREVFRTVYPAIQVGLQIAATEWQREGIRLDVSVLPPARTIERHLEPSLLTFSRAKDGLEFTSRQTLPGASVVGIAPVLAGAAIPAVSSARHAARTNQDINTMKNLMLAMHNHHDVYNRLPPAKWGTKGNTGLSWRVAILPFIEEEALYNEFHHDEPWDSEHNRELIKKMPAIYRPAIPQTFAVAEAAPAKEAPAGELNEADYNAYRTPFLTLRHPDSVFPPDVEKRMGFRGITDGTSRTIAIVKAAPASSVIWTKPDDLEFDPEKPLAGLIGPEGFFIAAFCDGHVSRISGNISEEIMKALVTRGGGEPINYEELNK